MCIILLFGIHSSAQHRSCRLKIVHDKLANITTAYTPDFSFSSSQNTLKFCFWRTGGLTVYSASVSSSEVFCINPASTAVLQFSDTACLVIQSSNVGNCTGSFQSYLRHGTQDAIISTLEKHNLSSVSIKGKDGETTFAISSSTAAQIRRYFVCLQTASL